MHFVEDTRPRCVVRQVLGAVAEFEKTTLVTKLAAARHASARRLRAQEPCRGSPGLRQAAKELARKKPKGGA
jgi:hypothetical protein